MANIKAFRALSPDPLWFNNLISRSDGRLRERIESRIIPQPKENVEIGLRRLLKEKFLIEHDEDSIYVYGQESVLGQQYGIWALSAVQDFVDGSVLGHEKTIVEKEELITQFRLSVGLEANPVLLTYRSNNRIEEFIEDVIQSKDYLCYKEDGKAHRIWKISAEPLISEITTVFKNIDRIYIGDGHHRFAAAAKMQNKAPQWIMALYVSTEQLSISSFNRLILPDNPIDTKLVFSELNKFFYISPVPSNVRYQPDRLHRIGLFLAGEWFQLDLKPELYHLNQLSDVVILQDKILAPILGISDPQTDSRLRCFPLTSFKQMQEISDRSKDAIIFNLFPMSIHKLIEHAENGTVLPPKSSFIEPKIPYGLMLNALEVLGKPVKEAKLC